MLHKLITANEIIPKTKIKANIQIILVRTVIQFVNLLNLEQNYWLKPKKVRRSKIIMYLWNSVINLIIEMLRIISQGKPAKWLYLGSNFIIEKSIIHKAFINAKP